jgi:hypothetical protein
MSRVGIDRSRVRCALLTLSLAIAGHPAPASAELLPCGVASDAGEIARVLARIGAAVDPCGESGLVRDVLETLRRCPGVGYRICRDADLRRNEFERPVAADGAPLTRVIHWNPGLRSELERGCGEDAAAPVLRDPAASLLHELAHAADDCRGLNPGERELDAVRVENVYRRAAGLCQRAAYGDDALPRAFVKECSPAHCSCATGRRRAADPLPAVAGERPSIGDAPSRNDGR